MALKRKLSDLYVKGKTVTLDDGKGEVEVYLQKIMPVDMETAFREANAAKATAMSLRSDPDSVMFQYIVGRCNAATTEDMVKQLADLEVLRKRRIIEAELESEDKWSKDDYLQGLHDAWESKLKEIHHTEPTEESEQVWKEMEAFNEELEKRIERERESILKDLESDNRDKIEDKFFDALMEQQAEITWFKEYRRQELYYAVRDPEDHSVKAFESPEEIDQVAPELIEKLAEAYAEISIDVTEGKD